VDWGRLKTIFIIAFLILDIFLLTQMVNKQRHTHQLEVKTNVSLEENLINDNIEYSGIPKETVRDQYMSANTKTFSEKEVDTLPDQHVTIMDGTLLYSELMHPIKMDESLDTTELDQFVKRAVLYGEQYGFGSFDKDAGTITYYQKHQDKFLFKNRSAHLVFYINKNSEVFSYEQTLLKEIKPISEKEEVLPAIRAVETIYRKNLLKPDSKIVKAEMGYYTVVNMEASQVLTPTWRIVIEKDKKQESMLVNAFEGQVIQENNVTSKKVME